MTLRLLIDADGISYIAAFSAANVGPDEACQVADNVLTQVICAALPFAEPEQYQTYLTGNGNFRFDLAVTAPYKGNRSDTIKPEWLADVRRWFINNGAKVSKGQEADDDIATQAHALDYKCIVAGNDKDFLQLPCTYLDIKKMTFTHVSEFEGLRNFYTQMLTGDTADNIKGIRGIGPVKAKKMLANCTNERELYTTVLYAYKNDMDRVLENGRLLWLRRLPGEIWEPPSL